MSIAATPNAGIPADVMADVQLVADCIATGKPIPDEVTKRVRERSECVTEETRRRHGVLNIAVPAIRELRGELPQTFIECGRDHAAHRPQGDAGLLPRRGFP
jgi:hypothetical protein